MDPLFVYMRNFILQRASYFIIEIRSRLCYTEYKLLQGVIILKICG